MTTCLRWLGIQPPGAGRERVAFERAPSGACQRARDLDGVGGALDQSGGSASVRCRAVESRWEGGKGWVVHSAQLCELALIDQRSDAVRRTEEELWLCCAGTTRERGEAHRKTVCGSFGRVDVTVPHGWDADGTVVIAPSCNTGQGVQHMCEC